MVLERFVGDKLKRALRKKAKQDFVNARGTIHRNEIQNAMDKLVKSRDEIIVNVQQMKTRRNELQALLHQELEQTLVSYIVNNQLTEIPGIGDIRASAIRNRVFRGQLGDLHNAYQLTGISSGVQWKISRWVREKEEQLPMLLQGNFRNKAQIEYKYRQEERDLDEGISTAESKLALITADLETLQQALLLLQNISEQDFFKALNGKGDNEAILAYMMGIFPEWEEPPDWYQRLVTGDSVVPTTKSASVPVQTEQITSERPNNVEAPVRTEDSSSSHSSRGSRNHSVTNKSSAIKQVPVHTQPPKARAGESLNKKGDNMEFSGSGNGVSDVIELEKGLYRITYRIKNHDTSVYHFDLNVISVTSGESNEIVYDNNSGAATYMVTTSGKYVLEIKYSYAPDIPSDWTLKIELLG